jgi:hypothetical protein
MSSNFVILQFAQKVRFASADATAPTRNSFSRLRNDLLIKILPHLINSRLIDRSLYPWASTFGGLVSMPAATNLLLTHCVTLWLHASPEDHMRRIVAQGDMRPMAVDEAAMEDLKNILTGRVDFFGKADVPIDASGKVLAEAYMQLRSEV